jgi:uncharacterized protein with PIN domain
MPTAVFRFYEELNDFLPAARRKRAFACACAESATVKHAIEVLGVPHTEVEVILVNGESVDFAWPIVEGDRVTVYPVFEALDVRPILRLRTEPLRDPRFVVDAHLGRLARYLRMLGFDSFLANAQSDQKLVKISCTQQRTLLTRDRELLMHRKLTHGVYVREERPQEQLLDVVDRLDLRSSCRPFTRCLNCNTPLVVVDARDLTGLVPPSVLRHHAEFLQCPDCARLFWRGSHHARMSKLVSRVMEG